MPRYFAAAPRGVEEVTAAELSALGAGNVGTDHGGVHFEGDRALLYRANIMLRTATRVLVPLRTFSAASPAMLYDQVRRVGWGEHLTLKTTFAVDCKVAAQHQSSAASPQPSAVPLGKGAAGPGRERQAGIAHSHFAALKIKDAIVDELRKTLGGRPDVDTKAPDVRVHAYLNGTRCTLSLDASGRSLHERGYRKADTGAPLKEALAAAIVDLSGWDGSVPLVDPMCGAGTVVIEAAMKALRVPPNLRRASFGFMRWPDFDRALWREVLAEATGRILHEPPAPIAGFDHDAEAIAISTQNAAAAKVGHAVRFSRQAIADLQPIGDRPGVVVMNPPYGKRLSDEPGLQALYKSIGDTLKRRMKGWTAFIFTGNLEMAKHIGLQTSRRITLFNGPLECRLLKYDLY